MKRVKLYLEYVAKNDTFGVLETVRTGDNHLRNKTTYVVVFSGYITRQFFFGKLESYINPARKCPTYIKVSLDDCYRWGHIKERMAQDGVYQWSYEYFLYIGEILTFGESKKVKIPNYSECIDIDIALRHF